MTNDQYKALWSKDDGSKTFVVVDVSTDRDMGSIIASSFEEAFTLLQHAINRNAYPAESILVEIVADNTFN